MSTVIEDKKSSMVTFQTADGPANGYLALPESKGPGVLILHAWWGLNDFFKTFCDRLAHEGYTVLAPDLRQGKIAETVDEAKALLSQSNEEKTFPPIVLGGLDHLMSQPTLKGNHLGVVGFSMGAAWALWLSTQRPSNIKAVITFYGTYAVDFPKSQASYLGHYASEDEWEPITEVHSLEEKIRKANRPVQFHIYPEAKHWFFEENRPNDYEPASATLAWKRTLDFLRTQLS